MSSVLVDTSVFIAVEAARPMAEVPATGSVSVVTVAELQIGVLMADDEARSERLRTLTTVERAFDAIPIDDEVARRFASLVASARRAGFRPQANDAWIAATAVVHDLSLYTQDLDFRMFGDELTVVEV